LGEALVRALPLILVAMTIVSLPLSSLVGIAALRNVDSWYNGVDPYGDREKADLLQYVVANTRTTDVFVAEDSMARWLEGYAQRRVVMHHPPMYLFLNGEIEREYVARAILLSTNGIRSRSAWVLDQFPYGRMCPLVQLYMKGDYDSVLYLDENTSYVTYADSETGHVYRLCFSNFTDRTGGIVNSPQGTFLIAKYQNDQVVLVRNATITSDGVEVQLAFTVRSMQADYKLVELAVNMCRCDERTFFEVWREPTNNSSEPSLRIVTDLGDFHIYSSSRTAFPFMFYPSSDGKVTGSLTMWSNETSSTDIDQVAYCSASLLRQWNISYVVIPMTGRVASPSNAEVRVMSIPLYDHLIRDPLFLVTYWNDRLILLSAKRI